MMGKERIENEEQITARALDWFGGKVVGRSLTLVMSRDPLFSVPPDLPTPDDDCTCDRLDDVRRCVPPVGV